MNTAHPNYGQSYRLMRAVLRMGEFTVSELQSLSGACENTVYSFLNKLETAGPGLLTSTQLASEGPGRPRKRYSLTAAGTTHLIERSLEMASRFGDATASSETMTMRPSSNIPAATDQATIGRSLVIRGEVTGSESLYIDGRVEGAINLPGNRVTIGRNAEVSANINARDVVILGKLRANINASDRVDIRSGGSLTGDVIAQRISIEDGAFFKGGIDIRKPGQVGSSAPAFEEHKVEVAAQAYHA